MKRLLPILLLLSISPTSSAGAGTNSVETAAENLKEAGPSKVERMGEVIDSYHSRLSHEVVFRANALDAWLSDSQYLADQDPEESTLKLRLSFRFKRNKSVQVSPALSGKLALPHFEKRFHLFVDNLERGLLPGESDENRTSDELKAGVRVSLLEKSRINMNLDGGIDMDPYPVPFSTLTASWRIPVRGWYWTLSQEGYWKHSDGFGETSEMDWDKTLATNVYFRSITAGNWSETTTGIEFEQTLRITWKHIPDQKEWEFSGSVFANKTSPFYMSNYRVMVNYWTQFLRPWFFVAIQPLILPIASVNRRCRVENQLNNPGHGIFLLCRVAPKGPRSRDVLKTLRR